MELGDNETHDPPVEDWHGISNPVALTVADHLLRHVPTPALDLASLPLETMTGPAQQVRRQLEAAGIAEKIAQGPSAFARIYDNMPSHQRPLDWKSRIDTPAALAQHVMENLDWYLGLPRAVKTPDWPAFFNTYALSVPITVLMVLIIGFAFLNAQGLALAQPYSSDFGRLMYAVIPIGVTITVISWLREYLRTTEDENVRCAVFYRYILESFSDQEQDQQPPGPGVLASTELAEAIEQPEQQVKTQIPE